MKQEQIKQQHNGLINCPLGGAGILMPGIGPIISSCPLPHLDYVVDAKVHMLMPGQYPCIPNWHGDFIPRDGDNNLLYEDIDDDNRMFLWLSGPPFTEFKDGRKIEPQKWIEFGQRDMHRGQISDEFQWRLFIRLAPAKLTVRVKTNPLRRHSQVYLDCNGFNW